MTYYIVQIPPRPRASLVHPDTDRWCLHEVPYRERRHAIAAVEAHRSYGFHDTDYIEVEGECEDENP